MPRKLPENAKAHQFKKGQSGNPKGRPPDRTLEQMFQDFLKEDVAPKPDTPKDARMRWFFMHLFSKAMGGSSSHARLIMEYSMSKPKQEVDLKASGNIIYQVVCGVQDPKQPLPDDPVEKAINVTAEPPDPALPN